jgi:hypothetical protein
MAPTIAPGANLEHNLDHNDVQRRRIAANGKQLHQQTSRFSITAGQRPAHLTGSEGASDAVLAGQAHVADRSPERLLTLAVGLPHWEGRDLAPSART